MFEWVECVLFVVWCDGVDVIGCCLLWVVGVGVEEFVCVCGCVLGYCGLLCGDVI